MAPLAPQEPQSANDYDDRTTEAVKSVLIEIGQILGSFRGKFAVIGGAVPWLLLHDAEMAHVGTLEVDGLPLQRRCRRYLAAPRQQSYGLAG